MSQIQSNLNKTLNDFEHGLNIVGYVPFVACISGSLRISYGKLEIIGAVAIAAIVAIRALFINNAVERDRELRRAAEILIYYSAHGFANIGRGMIEVVPLLSLVTCLPYDLLGKRMAYSTQEQHAWGQTILRSAGG
jgi:hypothetical protein